MTRGRVLWVWVWVLGLWTGGGCLGHEPAPSANRSTAWRPPGHDEAWQALSLNQKRAAFDRCVRDQSRSLLRSPHPPGRDVRPMRAEVLDRVRALGKRVVVVVFYGRRRYMRILLPYLLRNLRTHGGVVDQIWFYMNTRQPEDVQYARDVRANTSAVVLLQPDAELVAPGSFCNDLSRVKCRRSIQARLNHGWNYLRAQTGTLYLRIDDDVLFLEDGALEHLLYEKLFNPKYVLYSGNIVNSYQVPALHQLLGAWRVTNETHRFEFFGPGFTQCYMALAQHRNFLQNVFPPGATAVDEQAIRRYHFGLWDNTLCRCAAAQKGFPRLALLGGYNCNPRSGLYRWSINLFVWDAADVRYPIATYDELFFSQMLPRQQQKGTAVVGRAVAVHAMYNVQRKRCPDLDEAAAYLDDYHRLATVYCARPFP